MKSRSLREKKSILQGALWVFAGLMLLSVLSRSWLVIGLGAAVGAVFCILFWRWWRCPHCGKSLARLGEQGDFCTRCGEAIDWDKK